MPITKVHHFGEGVAAVAAVDEDTAEEALDLIKVDYEELPVVLTAEDALKPDAPLVNEFMKSNIALLFRLHLRGCGKRIQRGRPYQRGDL